LSGICSEVDRVKHFDALSRRVTEVDILKHHIASQSGQSGWWRGAKERLHFTRFSQQLPNSLGCSDGLLELAV
jgi:hypothetical protein